MLQYFLQWCHVLMQISKTNWYYNSFTIDKNMRLFYVCSPTFWVVVDVKMVVWIIFCSILCTAGMMKTALKSWTTVREHFLRKGKCSFMTSYWNQLVDCLKYLIQWWWPLPILAWKEQKNNGGICSRLLVSEP